MFLSDLSIKRPIMMSMFLIVFVLFGFLAFVDMNLQLMPDFRFPIVLVQTVYPGAGPQELETQVTKKIEDAIAPISGVEYFQSYSMENVSLVVISFEMEKDTYEALQEVKDKVDGILNDLPDDSERPIVQKVDLTETPVTNLILSGPLSVTELYDVADKSLNQSFAQVPGVASVTITGGQEREIHIELNNRTVIQRSISLPQLSGILAAQNLDMPGGNFQKETQEFSVRLDGQFKSIAEIKALDIPTSTGTIKLDEIADIYDSSEDVRERTTYFNNITKEYDDNVIQLSIMKTSDGNAVEIFDRIQEELPNIIATLPEGCELEMASETASFIRASVKDTLVNILLGVILTSLVLFFFLHDYRSTIIVALSMPMSLISAFLFMQMAGFTLNVMSLMGLSTAVGILVSNSIVVLENIFRYKDLGKSNIESASIGTSQIAVAVIASTLTNIAVFLPLGTMSSIAGQMFKQFSITVVFATIFSLLMSFTLTPMLASIILPEKQTKARPISDKIEAMFRRWENGYKRSLQWILSKKVYQFATILIAIILLIISFGSFKNISFDFIPSMDEGFIMIKVELPVGYNLDETADVVDQVEDRLKQFDDVSHFWTTLGKFDDTNTGVNLALIRVKLVDSEQRQFKTDEIIAELKKDVSIIPNAFIRIKSETSMSSGRSDTEFDLLGPDMKTLEGISSDLVKEIRQLPSVVNVTSSVKAGKPEVSVYPDRYKLLQAGLTVSDLGMAVRSGVSGVTTTSFDDAGEEYDIVVTLDDESVDSPQDIRNIPVVGPNGTYLIGQVADVIFTEGYSQIQHMNKSKSVNISMDFAQGYVMGDVQNDINKILAEKVVLPAGYSIRWGAMAREMNKAVVAIIRAFFIAILLTYMLLAAILESLTQPLIILGTIPMALIGVIYGMLISGLSMNIISMLAIVMLIGIVVNNAILQLDYTNILTRQEKKTKLDALLIACPAKLKPILMSTIAIILGMMPMALGIGESGAQVRQPMGVVSIGGLTASAILSLYLIPVLYNLTIKERNAGGEDA